MAYISPPGCLDLTQTTGSNHWSSMWASNHMQMHSHTLQNAFRWTNLLSPCPPFQLTSSTPSVLACLSGAKGKVSKRTASFFLVVEGEKERKKREGEEEGKAISPVHEQTRGGQFGAFSHRCACS